MTEYLKVTKGAIDAEYEIPLDAVREEDRALIQADIARRVAVPTTEEQFSYPSAFAYSDPAKEKEDIKASLKTWKIVTKLPGFFTRRRQECLLRHC